MVFCVTIVIQCWEWPQITRESWNAELVILTEKLVGFEPRRPSGTNFLRKAADTMIIDEGFLQTQIDDIERRLIQIEATRNQVIGQLSALVQLQDTLRTPDDPPAIESE